MAIEYSIFIDGKWMQAHGGETMEVVNPASGEMVGLVPLSGPGEVDLAVKAAGRAAPGWAATPVSERSKVLLRLSRLIMENQEDLALLETREHGSPIRKTMNFDVPLCAEQLEFFAGAARAMGGETLPVGPWCASLTIREPIGVVGLITPWNFPALMVVWKLGAALVTGNTCVVKPPSTAPLTTLRLAKLAQEAGLPDGVLNVVTGPGPIVGEALVRHPEVDKIGFTGDTATGKRIMSAASENVTQIGLELGGKNAFVVMADADLDAAVEGAVFAAFFNSGQVCAAASRFYIHDSMYDQFADKFVKAAKDLRMGDPENPNTVLGPVAFASHRDSIDAAVEKAIDQGAKLLLGGVRPRGPELDRGCYVAPTIFGDCDHKMDLMRKEIFGPVVGLARFTETEEAISLANDTDYGLSASIWTRDMARGISLASGIKAGTVWINEHLIIFCETPWGGCKQSGWGKDLSTRALEEYTHLKHVYLDLTGAREKPWYAILK